MSLVAIEHTLATPDGTGVLFAVVGRSYLIRAAPNGAPVALYADRAGAIALPNPVAVDDGDLSFYVEEGDLERVDQTTGEVHPFTAVGRAFGMIPVTQKATANGVATLDGAGKIPAAQLPSTPLIYRGVWDAAANTPALANGAGAAGDTYRVTTAAVRNLGGGDIAFAAGDLVIYNGAVWQRAVAADLNETRLVNAERVATGDSFTRSDRQLNGDTAPDGGQYVGAGTAMPVISGNRYKTAAAPGTSYLTRVYDRAPDWMSIIFAVTGAVPSASVSPTLGLLANKASDGMLTNLVHAILTDTSSNIQLIDGTGGAAVVSLSPYPYPGSYQDIGGGTYQLPPGIYRALIERIGNTVIMTDPLGRTHHATDPRIGAFWPADVPIRLDWEIKNDSAGRTIEVLYIDQGRGRPPRGGALHGGRLPIDPILSEAIRAVGGAGNPAFQNGWLNYDAGSAGCGFWRDALGIVHIQGEIKSGVFASGFSTVFTLPSELDAAGREIYRPAQRRKYSATPQGTVISGVFYPWHVEIATNGNVQIFGTGLAAPALLALGDITYRPRSLVA